MNIFVLESTPEASAGSHCDKHVVKMCVESTQMLTCAYHLTGHTFEGFPRRNDLGMIAPYRMTHVNHPCTRWACLNSTNFEWLLRLNEGLTFQFRARYSGHPHSVERILWWMRRNPPRLPSGRLTPFVQAMPREFRSNDPIQAYRLFYASKAARMNLTWRYGAPSWYTPELVEQASSLLVEG